MRKRIIPLLAVLWLAALLRLTVFRNGCFSHGLFSGRIEWDAFAYYAKLVRVGNWRYFSYLFVGNLVWFVPVGVLVRLREAFPLGGRCQRASHASPLTDEGRSGDELFSVAHRCAPLQNTEQAGKQCLSLQAHSVGHRSGLLRAALWGFLLSLGIETMQYVLGSGVSELDDLILNSCGAVLGFGIVCIFDKMRKNIKSPIDKNHRI
ncbi:MAG: VanZ family protein [Oscillospiraceae bacterium]|nr:VanZ family protein [Oscillospiraceae bacterium]